jgi:hypothetical protein
MDFIPIQILSSCCFVFPPQIRKCISPHSNAAEETQHFILFSLLHYLHGIHNIWFKELSHKYNGSHQTTRNRYCVAPKSTTSKLKTKEICKNMEEQIALRVHVVVLGQYGQLFGTYYYYIMFVVNLVEGSKEVCYPYEIYEQSFLFSHSLMVSYNNIQFQ